MENNVNNTDNNDSRPQDDSKKDNLIDKVKSFFKTKLSINGIKSLINDKKEKRNNRTKKVKPEHEHGPIMVQEPTLMANGHLLEGTLDRDVVINEHYRFEANKKYFVICVYAIVTVVVAALIIYLFMNLDGIGRVFKSISKALSAFITGFFIAFILNPLVKWLDNTVLYKLVKVKNAKVRIALSILSAYIAVITLLVVVFSYIIPQLATSINDLIKRQESLYSDILAFFNRIKEEIPTQYQATIEEQMSSLWQQLVERAKTLAIDILPNLLNFSTSIFNLGYTIIMTAINILLAICISIYMLYEKRNISKMMVRFVYAILPIRKASPLVSTFKECSNIFSSFVVGKTIDSLIIGILCFIIMKILGLPYVVLVSVIIGVTNMIPFFGPFIGAIPCIILFLLINPVDAFIFAIMIFAIQQFDGWILGPFILGGSTGLSPLWVIFAITLGGAYFGLVGMFLGVPVIAVISFLLNRLVEGKLKKKKVLVK